MDFYIEDALVNNFALCFFASVSAYRFLSHRASFFRTLFASVFAAVVSLIYPLVNGSVYYVLFKAASIAVASVILFTKKQKYLPSFTVFALFDAGFFAVSFALGSVNPILLGGGRVIYAFGLYTLPICFVCFCALFCLSCAVNALRARSSLYIEAECVIDGVKYALKTLFDTGNSAFDYASGLSVVIVSESSLKGLKKSSYAGEIGFRSASGKGVAKLIYPERFTYYSGKKAADTEVAIGVVNQRFDGFDAIAGPSAMGGEV